MYYKITNKESKVYQELHSLRTKEIEIEGENIYTIKKATGLTWNRFLGSMGQLNFRRVTQYSGFEFIESDKINPKVWKKHIAHSSIYVPNQRTKAGREMHSLLLNGLKNSQVDNVFQILKLERPLRFIFPFVEICGETILIYLDDNLNPTDENVIEITSKEFKGILDERSKS